MINPWFNVGSGSVYYWLGKERGQLKKKQLNILGYIMFGLQFAQILVIVYVLKLQLKANKMNQRSQEVYFKIERTSNILIFLMLITAFWYCIRFILYLFKKTLRCCFGDDCFRC